MASDYTRGGSMECPGHFSCNPQWDSSSPPSLPSFFWSLFFLFLQAKLTYNFCFSLLSLNCTWPNSSRCDHWPIKNQFLKSCGHSCLVCSNYLSASCLQLSPEFSSYLIDKHDCSSLSRMVGWPDSLLLWNDDKTGLLTPTMAHPSLRFWQVSFPHWPWCRGLSCASESACWCSPLLGKFIFP